jgi:hypothetical protein
MSLEIYFGAGWQRNRAFSGACLLKSQPRSPNLNWLSRERSDRLAPPKSKALLLMVQTRV